MDERPWPAREGLTLVCLRPEEIEEVEEFYEPDRR
jgi:hypothetical protein